MEDDAKDLDLVAVDVDNTMQANLDRHPLPENVPDADMNQEEISAAFNTSVNTVSKWIKSGMPVAQEGGNGKSYVLRLSHCWAWRAAQQATEKAHTLHNKAVIEQMHMNFFGVESDQPGASLTAKDRIELSNAAFAEAKARQARRQLVRLEEVTDILDTIFTIMSEGVEALSDRLERELNLKPEQVTLVVRAGSDILNEITQRIEKAELEDRDIADMEISNRLMI